jgi:nitroreductase
METLDAIRLRASTRAFLDQPVDRALIETLLEAARWAPSGVNTQPWQVVVVTGLTKEKLSLALAAARASGTPDNPDYAYYPAVWLEPYKSRRKACGLALYQAQGIALEDAQKRKAAWLDNYRFFGAPVGLLFFLDNTLATGSWVDMGMFIQNVMLAAVDRGLATCPQASIAEYPDIVRALLHIPAQRALVCGMSLGYADASAAVNHYRTARAAVDTFTQWHD